jgi:CHAT domain-containing protein
MGRVLEQEPAGEPATEMFRLMLHRSTQESAVLAELYRGVEARAAGDDEAAESHFEEAIRRGESLGAGGVLLHAVALATARRMSGARKIFHDLVATGQLPPDLAANFLTRVGEYESAEKQLDRYDAIALEPPSDERPWERQALRAEILVGTGRPSDAVGVADTALAAFESHLAGLSRDVLRTMATDSPVAAGLYTTAVRAHTDLAQETDAATHVDAGFALSDRSRGAALTDLIDLDRAAGEDPAAVGAVRSWLRAGASLARTIEEVGRHGSPGDDADVRARIRAAERELDDTEAALAATAPALLEGRRRLPASRSITQTREQLDANTVLLQYHAYDDRLILWAVTKDSARVVSRESITPVLVSRVRRCHSAISDPRSSAAARDELGEPLSELLLAPVADELSAHRRVVLVPHGPLAVLPFHVLPFDGSDLATTHEVSYLPAASAARPASARRIGPDARTLVVGDPDYGPASPLRPLPGAKAEAIAVGGLRKTAPLIGSAASRAAVLGALEEADVVHLATHGGLVEGSPFSAELALSQGTGLTVPDLMGLDTSISLAVLSACDSGRGRATAAGDVIGLTRSLMAAGASELVVSLWPVDDLAASLTMVRLHAELLGGRSPAQALQAAARAVRGLSRAAALDSFRSLTADAAAAGSTRTARNVGALDDGTAPPPDLRHPFYWAPFVHIGL